MTTGTTFGMYQGRFPLLLGTPADFTFTLQNPFSCTRTFYESVVPGISLCLVKTSVR